MAGTIFFGTLYDTQKPGTSATTSNALMTLVPAPATGMQAGAEGFSEVLHFENGGAAVVAAAATHRVYNMDWNTQDASLSSGLDLIKAFQQRIYGPGLIYWANPMLFDRNMLHPALASPGLIEQGWKNIYTATPTYANTASNIYSQPKRSAVWTVTGTANAVPTNTKYINVVPIHPLYTLNLGFSGSATGTAVVAVRPINLDGSYASVTNLTLLSATASTRMNATFSGATYKAVEIYITRTSTASSTITLTSGMAQQYLTGVSPVLPTSHILGEGDTGLKFTSDAIVESYVMAGRHLKGMSASLTEVGAWLP